MSLKELEEGLYKSPKNDEKKGDENSFQSSVDLKNMGKIGWSGGKEEGVDGLRAASILEKYGKIFIFSLISILILALGFAGFYLYQFFTTKDATISMSGPSEILVGVPFKVSAVFENISNKTLSGLNISLNIPNGAAYISDGSKRIVSEEIGDVLAGELVKRDFDVIITGKPFQAYQFSVVASYGYGTSGLSGRFEKKSTGGVLAKDYVVNLDLSAPQKVLNGEDFEVHLKYQNIGDSEIKNVRVVFKVPQWFVLNNSDPIFSNMSIDEPSLKPKDEKFAIFSGSVMGRESSSFQIQSVVQIKVGGYYFDIASKESLVLIEQSPLSLVIDRSNVSDQVAYPGQELSYKLSFKNNSDINLSFVVLKAKLAGEMFDVSTIKSSGYFDGVQKTITWTAANLPILKGLGAGQDGYVLFSIKLKENYPITRLSDKNFVLKISGEISSPTVPSNVSAQKTIGVAEFSQKVAGRLDFAQKAYFQEPYGDIVNIGALPPKVGVPIQYTIHWDLASYASDFENTTIRAFFGPGIKWTGKTKTSAGTSILYNDRTQEVVWNVGDVMSGYGILQKGPEAVFQVEFLPSVNQVGERFSIVEKTNLFSRDKFIEKDASTDLKTIESKDLSDISLPAKFDKVTASSHSE